jgi:hypothetical protein
VTTRQPPATEPLAGILPDWRVHLRAKGRSRRTIDSYLSVAEVLCDYLVKHNIPTEVTSVKRATSRSIWPICMSG